MDAADRILRINQALNFIVEYSRYIYEEPANYVEVDDAKEAKKKDPVVPYADQAKDGTIKLSVRGMIEKEHPLSSPEQIDRAIKRQQDAYNSLSPDGKKRVDLMYGNPNNPEYWEGEETVKFSPMPSTSYGLHTPGIIDSESDILVNKGHSTEVQQRSIDHEMAHAKQYDQYHQGSPEFDRAAFNADRNNDYGDRGIEVGAENRAAMRHIRRVTGALRPIEDMAARLKSRRYHESDYNKFPHALYKDGRTAPDEVDTEVESKYLPNYIGMKPGEKGPKSGSIPGAIPTDDTRMV